MHAARLLGGRVKTVYDTKIVIAKRRNLVTMRVLSIGIWFIVIPGPLRHTEDTREVKRLHE